MDVKTLLRTDKMTRVGNNYKGVLMRDGEDHYTFLESMHPSAGRRNPHVFIGKYITVTRNKDGSLHLNFKRLEIDGNFSVEKYALGVYNEICMALYDLVEE